MTVSEMDNELKQLLGDPNSYRWTQSNHRLPALNIAQRQISMKLLGMGTKLRPAFDLLLGIQANKTIPVGTTGYDLSGLHPSPGRMLSETGFMRAEVTLDGITQRCIQHSPEKEGLQQNRYLTGNNEYPVLRFEAGKVFVDVDDGEYPVDVTLYYIREPKELVISGASGYQVTTCELNTGLHDVIVKYAEATCRRMGEDYEQYQLLMNEIELILSAIAMSSIESIKTSTAGQFTRKIEA